MDSVAPDAVGEDDFVGDDCGSDDLKFDSAVFCRLRAPRVRPLAILHAAVVRVHSTTVQVAVPCLHPGLGCRETLPTVCVIGSPHHQWDASAATRSAAGPVPSAVAGQILGSQFADILQLRLQFLSLLAGALLQQSGLLQIVQQVADSRCQFFLLFFTRHNRNGSRDTDTDMRWTKVIVIRRFRAQALVAIPARCNSAIFHR